MRLKIVRTSYIVVAMLMTLATSAAHASPLLFGAERNASGGNLVTLDPLTGATTAIIGSLGSIRVTGLAFDPLTGVLFGSTGGFGTVIDSLITIDPTSAGVTVIGNLSARMPDIAFDASGTLFGFSRIAGSLFTINTATAGTTLVGNPNISGGGNGLEFGLDGTLYFAPSSLTQGHIPPNWLCSIQPRGSPRALLP